MIKSFNRFVYRIPAAPIETLVNPLAAADVESYLRSVFSQPFFMEALFMASPEFTNEIPGFMEGKITEPKRLSRFRHTALKYIGRMASRPTPFGLFSGCSVGKFEKDNQICPDSSVSLSPKLRLDMGLLTSFAEYIFRDPELRRTLRFYSNNTIYRFGKKNRYVEYVIKEGEKLYNLASFEPNEYIDQILSLSAKGAGFSDYYQLLVSEDISEADIDEFVNELIDSKILISELEPWMTGTEYHEQLYSILREKNELALSGKAKDFYSKSLQVFDRVWNKMQEISEDPVAKGPHRYQAIIDELKNLDFSFSFKHYLQLDSAVKQGSQMATLDEAILKDISEGVSIVTRFASHSSNGSLQEFKKKLQAKYEGQRVRLVEVLDPEAGIGYGNLSNEMLDITPFVDDMPVGSSRPVERRSLSWHSEQHGLLLRKTMEAQKANQTAVQLSKQDIEVLKPKTELLPPTFNAFVTVFFDEKGQHQIYFHQVGATSASCLLGRFGFLETDIRELIRDIQQREADYYPGKIVAEINHLSESRAGNVMLRPRTREYEICYLTKSNKPEEGQIDINDLYLQLHNGKLLLYSASLDKEIVPRLSNAHNYYKDTLPVYRFLSDLQEEDGDGYLALVTDMGSIPELVDFIPRVSYRNFVLWPAHWYIKTDEIRKFFELPDEEFSKAMQAYLSKRNVPEWFYLTNRENDLLVDSSNPYSLRLFVEEIKNHPRFAIKESFHQRNSRFLISNSKGNFLHELIVPFSREPLTHKPAEQPKAAPASVAVPAIQRRFFPGEEWVYFKVYAGVKVSEKILSSAIAPLIEFLKESGVIDQWFFIRYTDPSFHLRIRLHLTDKKLFGAAVENFNIYFRDYLEAGTIRNITLDTYERELERYGGELTLAAERIFALDSDLVVFLLDEIENKRLGSFKWLFAMYIMEKYMEVFGMDEDERLSFSKRIRDLFAMEFNANKMQRRYFSARYRTSMEQIDQFLGEHQLEGQSPDWFVRAVHQFTLGLSEIVQQQYATLTRAEKEDQLNSFIHMFIDRFFSSKNRLHEYALYSLLEQHYRYSIGKKKHMQNEETI